MTYTYNTHTHNTHTHTPHTHTSYVKYFPLAAELYSHTVSKLLSIAESLEVIIVVYWLWDQAVALLDLARNLL